MRLLSSTTYALKYFMDARDIPHYAILSHTWEGGEVTLQDLLDPKVDEKSMKGWYKIQKCCEQADMDGYRWVWIDSCCIDKTSSAELSEAINSMFRWYENAHICYAYLADVPSVSAGMKPTIMKSRWFTRGWTLQELIAPSSVEFYDQKWNEVGTKRSLAAELNKTTTIPIEILLGQKSHLTCLAGQRFSWSARRETSREEDAAYCLLGLFDINMPLLYGEGHKSFYRLQEQILKSTGDFSLLLWSTEGNEYGEARASVFLTGDSSLFRPLWYKNMKNPAYKESRANWSQVSNYSSLSRSADSIAFTASGLRVELPRAVQYGPLGTNFLWTHQLLYSEDGSSILGMICIKTWISNSQKGPIARTCEHLWLIPGPPPGLNLWDTYNLMISLPVTKPQSLLINRYYTQGLYGSNGLLSRVELSCAPNLEHPWNVNEVLVYTAGAAVEFRAESCFVSLLRCTENFQGSSPFYSFAHLRLGVKMLFDGTETEIKVIVSLCLDIDNALCGVRQWTLEEHSLVNTSRTRSIFEGKSDRDEVHIPGTDLIVKIAVKLRSTIVEYRLSVQKSALSQRVFEVVPQSLQE